MSLKTLTIGIAAYNAEKNIDAILVSLLSQVPREYILEKIIVYSDASEDSTVIRAHSVVDPRIIIIDGGVRSGFGNAVKTMLALSTSDLTMLLNDDIYITSSDFLNEAVKPFYESEEIGLLSANPQPFRPQNFYERAAVSSFHIFEKMRYSIRGGNNLYTCDGKVLVFSKAFKDKIKFPADYSLMGNVDTYLYFLCLEEGFLYRHSKKAVVWFKSPSFARDYIAWTMRNTADFNILKKQFGQIVISEYHRPVSIFVTSFFQEFFINPFGCFFLIFAHYYIALKSLFSGSNEGALWSTVESTKGFKK